MTEVARIKESMPELEEALTKFVALDVDLS